MNNTDYQMVLDYRGILMQERDLILSTHEALLEIVMRLQMATRHIKNDKWCHSYSRHFHLLRWVIWL